MTTRTAILDYRTTGTEGAAARVVSIETALRKQREAGERLAPVLKKTTVDAGLLGSVSQSASAKITSLTNTLGPLGAGLGTISRNAPLAASGLLKMVAAQERASLLSRTLNVALLGGASAMAIGGVAAVAYADDALRAADSYATLHARIRTFSEGAISAAATERDLYATAKNARTSVADLTTLYTRLTPAVHDYGKSQQDALTITQLTSKALAIQGADVREQAAATVQFSQAIASGVLRGDELRSLLESSPQLLRYIAQNLEINGKVGVAFSQLRNLGNNGLITTDKLINALLKAQPAIERDFINAPKTAQQGWIVLKDQIVRTVGTIDQTLGGQKAVVAWLGKMAEGAEAWRQKMLLDPKAFDAVKDVAGFIGDAVASIADLGQLAIENFDKIVAAGQAIIALKLGQVIANSFATAATASRTALANLVEFQQQAGLRAGMAANPIAGQAATASRAASAAADARAVELTAAAELKLAQATAARTAAYTASNQVNVLKLRTDVTALEITNAQTQATALTAAAVRAETAAKAAGLAASNATAAATTRNIIAKEAEAAATVELTFAQVALGVAQKAALGLYSLMGGAIGVATLVIGGLIWAVLEAQKAEKAHYEAMRDSVDITDKLRAATDSMAAATWAEIPGIIAKTQALRDQAAAQEKVLAAQLKDKQGQLETLRSQQGNGLSAEASEGNAYQMARLEREIRALGGIVGGARQRAAAANDSAYAAQIIAAGKQKADANSQLTRGTDAAGRPLTDTARETLKATVTRQTAYLTAQVDKLDGDIRIVDAKLADARTPAKDKVGLGNLRKDLGSRRDAASEGALSGAPSTFVPPTPKPKKVPGNAGVTAAYTDLLKSGFLNLTGGQGFAANNGGVTLNGQPVKARSDDEATALAKYVKVVESLNDATDAQIKKSADALGVQTKTRAELKAAAGAILAHELATSKAAQADDRWEDIKAEMSGSTRSEVKAQRELNDLVEDGATITDASRKAYLAWIAAREVAAKLQRGLQTAQPVVQRGFDLALAGQTRPVDGQGVLDEKAATEQLMAARAVVMLDRDRAVREEIARRVRAGDLLEQDSARATADATAAYQVAVEISTQDQLLEIRKARLQESRQAQEQQIQETSDAISGAVRDAAFGADVLDSGKHLALSLLQAMYDELITNPLNQLIRSYIRNLVSAQSSGGSGGGGGLWKTLGNAALNAIRYSGNGQAASQAASALDASRSAFDAQGFVNPTMPTLGHADGRIPGYADGRMDGVVFRGRGGPRGDDNLVRISDQESIITAKTTRRYRSVLELMEQGKFDPYAGLPRHADGYMPPVSVAAGMGGGAGGWSGKEGDVIVKNYGEPMKGTRRRDDAGNTHIDLRPLARDIVREGARSGAVEEGMKQKPQPTRRG